jgi:hypothetical protein
MVLVASVRMIVSASSIGAESASPGERAPFERESRAIRIAAQLVAAFHE